MCPFRSLLEEIEWGRLPIYCAEVRNCRRPLDLFSVSPSHLRECRLAFGKIYKAEGDAYSKYSRELLLAIQPAWVGCEWVKGLELCEKRYEEFPPPANQFENLSLALAKNSVIGLHADICKRWDDALLIGARYLRLAQKLTSRRKPPANLYWHNLIVLMLGGTMRPCLLNSKANMGSTYEDILASILREVRVFSEDRHDTLRLLQSIGWDFFEFADKLKTVLRPIAGHQPDGSSFVKTASRIFTEHSVFVGAKDLVEQDVFAEGQLPSVLGYLIENTKAIGILKEHIDDLALPEDAGDVKNEQRNLAISYDTIRETVLRFHDDAEKLCAGILSGDTDTTVNTLASIRTSCVFMIRLGEISQMK